MQVMTSWPHEMGRRLKVCQQGGKEAPGGTEMNHRFQDNSLKYRSVRMVSSYVGPCYYIKGAFDYLNYNFRSDHRSGT
jgi:hypothetical protein